ncbi:MAG TPA: family 2A encapsulin nanocompartment cargo protein cysteine desulfurase [Terriglobales bacterium]
MSTSDPSAETVLQDAEDVQGKPAGSGVSLPDLEVITRLANEFFAAVPSQPSASGIMPVSPVAPSEAKSPVTSDVAGLSSATAPSAATNVPPSIPGTPAQVDQQKANSPGTARTYPSGTELFTFSGVPGFSAANLSSTSPLTETELSSIPSSLTDAPLRPSAFTSAAPPSVPCAPAYFSDVPKASPFGVAPTFPDDVFSFANVPPPASSISSPQSSSSTDPHGRIPAQSVPDYSQPRRKGVREEASQTNPNAAEPKLDSFEFRPELVPNIGLAKRTFDPYMIKRDFPILQEQIHGRSLVWLDNGATTQKPNAVIDRINHFYRHENSNIHRAAHTLAARSTDAYEGARDKVRRFLNASSSREIIFVRGATEGINLIAKSWGHRNVQKDDEIVITWLEHHANIVPWQQLAAEKGARLRVAPVDNTGQIILEEYEKLLGPKIRIVAFSQVSNALGTITPAKEMIEMAHRHGACVLLDAAQSVAHMTTDVQALDCDFLVFSGHKIFAPTGVGAVFGKADLLQHMPPWQGGGNMIADVTFEKTIYSEPPGRFEAGTGTIADAVGLGAALDYLEEIGMENISEHEHQLLAYGTAGLLSVPGLRIIGNAKEKAGVLSFVLDSLPPEEIGKELDQEGIAVRAGHHCAQPILRRFGLEKTVRATLALYNTREDLDALVAALQRIQAGRTNS